MYNQNKMPKQNSQQMQRQQMQLMQQQQTQQQTQQQMLQDTQQQTQQQNIMNNVNGIISRGTDAFSAPYNWNTGEGVLGSYDNLQLKTNCGKEGWRKPPCNTPKKSSLMFLPQGTPLPLKNEMIYSELPKDSMFILAESVSSPDCCPSTFSTDRGCVCTTPLQRKYIGEMRGSNKTYENYYF